MPVIMTHQLLTGAIMKNIKPIYTMWDARNDALIAEANAEYKIMKKFLTAKVKHWQKQVDKFGGEIHKMTLQKFQQQLQDLG